MSFSTVVPELVKRWHVFALDHRGHGPSGRVPGGYRVVDYAGDATAFVRERVREPVVLWGQSLGANVAIAVAAGAPEWVRAVVLEEPAVDPEEAERSRPFLRQARDLAASGRSAEELYALLAEVTVEIPGREEPMPLGALRGEEYLRLTADTLSQLDPEVLTFALDERILEGHEVEALLPQVVCPALFLQGDPALGGLEGEVAGRAADLLPSGRLVKVPQAGHNVHRTQPEAALEAVREFLGSVVSLRR
jgi:pimeloyl-ACP methyl ester carboxylesterase